MQDADFPRPSHEETGRRPELWTQETLKARLLEGVAGSLPRIDEIPSALRLNHVWTNVLNDVFFMSTQQNGPSRFYEAHPEENIRLLKTDAERNKVLVQDANQMGAHDHVSINTKGLIEGTEVVLGTFHKHPFEANFSSEDIVPLLLSRGHFIEGLVDPQSYYLTFRTQDTRTVSDSYDIARGYLLGVGKNHGATHTRHSQGNDVFTMSAPMFQELGLPLYVGRRGQDTLHLASH